MLYPKTIAREYENNDKFMILHGEILYLSILSKNLKNVYCYYYRKNDKHDWKTVASNHYDKFSTTLSEKELMAFKLSNKYKEIAELIV